MGFYRLILFSCMDRKKSKKIRVVATHSGTFHADDVFAVSVLRLIYPNARVMRTRNTDELKKADIRIDVGGVYHFLTKDFDHHQRGGAGMRENGIPYASAGLIWKHFGKRLVSSDEVFNQIDAKIIQYVDADDVGFEGYTVEKLKPYTVSDFISGLNPHWPNVSSALFDSYFEEAVSIVVNLLKREIEGTEGIFKAKTLLRKKIKGSTGKYIVLDEYLPWKETLVQESNLYYIVYRDPIENNWLIMAVPVSLDSFENRKDLPKSWAGLVNEALQKVTGVKDATFCHNNLFCAVAKTKQGAIKLVELALKNG